MLAAALLMVALAATGFAQVPAGYRKVYITSLVNTKFVIVPKAPVKSGTTTVVFVSHPRCIIDDAMLTMAVSTISSQTRNDKPEQQWYIKDGSTKIQLADTTLCMDAGAKS